MTYMTSQGGQQVQSSPAAQFSDRRENFNECL